MTRATFVFAAVVLLSSTLASCSAFAPDTGEKLTIICTDADSDPMTNVSFHDDIRPLMDRFSTDPSGPGCHFCHYRDGTGLTGITIGKLDMTTLGDLRKGGITSGANVVVAGKPCESAIVEKLLGTYGPAPAQMPKLAPRYWNAQEVQLVIDWIAEGAVGGDAE